MKRRNATAAVLALLLASTAVSAQQDAPQPVLYALFIDLSDSGKGQEGHWSAAAERMVFSRFRPGDALLIFGIHDHTAESAPLFPAEQQSWETFSIDMKAGMKLVTESRRRFQDVLTAGRRAVQDAFKKQYRAKETKIVEGIRRIPRVGNRQVRAVFFSDVLESTSGLNLERLRLTDQNTSPLVEVATKSHRLKKDSHAGVSVSCVLDSPRIGQSPSSPNSRDALEQFWKALFEFVGARLQWFDSTAYSDGR